MEEDDAVVVSLDVEEEEDGSVAIGLVRGVTGTLLLAVVVADDDDVEDTLLGVVNVLLSAASLMCCCVDDASVFWLDDSLFRFVGFFVGFRRSSADRS